MVTCSSLTFSLLLVFIYSGNNKAADVDFQDYEEVFEAHHHFYRLLWQQVVVIALGLQLSAVSNATNHSGVVCKQSSPWEHNHSYRTNVNLKAKCGSQWYFMWFMRASKMY